jgi:solute carrier family 35, member F5
MLPISTVLRNAAIFCLLWFIANYSYNVSLDMTSFSSSEIISTTSSIHTLLLSRIFLKEQITPSKVLAVLMWYVPLSYLHSRL